MKNNLSSLSTGLMLATGSSSQKQVQLTNDMAGIFIVVHAPTKLAHVNPNTTFFYYENKSSHIVNHLVYRGKSYYKEQLRRGIL